MWCMASMPYLGYKNLTFNGCDFIGLERLSFWWPQPVINTHYTVWQKANSACFTDKRTYFLTSHSYSALITWPYKLSGAVLYPHLFISVSLSHAVALEHSEQTKLWGGGGGDKPLNTNNACPPKNFCFRRAFQLHCSHELQRVEYARQNSLTIY